MHGYLLVAFLFLAIITFSIALPPALEDLIEGVEKSVIARHSNMDIYGEQLAHLIVNAETVLTDQSAEDKEYIPLFYGAESTPLLNRPFVNKPVNILRPHAIEDQVNMHEEKPFDRIKIHNYGFGEFCNRAEEEKIVRGLAALAVAHKIRRNPAVIEVFEDKSEDSNFNRDVINHKKLVRGIFADLIGENLNIDRDRVIDRSVNRIIDENRGRFYRDNLKRLFDNSFDGGTDLVPFKMSPYNNYYLVRSFPLSEELKGAKEFFSWIQKVPAVTMGKAINTPRRLPMFNNSFALDNPIQDINLMSSDDDSDDDTDSIPSNEPVFSEEMKESADSSSHKGAARTSKANSIVGHPDESAPAGGASESVIEGNGSDKDIGDNKTEDAPKDSDKDDDFVKVDDEDYSPDDPIS